MSQSDEPGKAATPPAQGGGGGTGGGDVPPQRRVRQADLPRPVVVSSGSQSGTPPARGRTPLPYLPRLPGAHDPDAPLPARPMRRTPSPAPARGRERSKHTDWQTPGHFISAQDGPTPPARGRSEGGTRRRRSLLDGRPGDGLGLMASTSLTPPSYVAPPDETPLQSVDLTKSEGVWPRDPTEELPLRPMQSPQTAPPAVASTSASWWSCRARPMECAARSGRPASAVGVATQCQARSDGVRSL